MGYSAPIIATVPIHTGETLRCRLCSTVTTNDEWKGAMFGRNPYRASGYNEVCKWCRRNLRGTGRAPTHWLLEDEKFETYSHIERASLLTPRQRERLGKCVEDDDVVWFSVGENCQRGIGADMTGLLSFEEFRVTHPSWVYLHIEEK